MRGDVEQLIHLLGLHGGAAPRAVIHPISDQTLRWAVEHGDVVRIARGRYALASAAGGHRLAVAFHAAQSHRSAALVHGMKVATPPPRPELVVPRGRGLSGEQLRLAHIRRRDLDDVERRHAVTSPLRTVLDCLRDLRPDEAVPVADSALNRRLVTHEELQLAAARLRGPGSVRARRSAELVDGRAANPFESRLRLIGLDVEGLRLVPQVTLRCGDLVARADLVDERLGIVAEADSFEWHGGREALVADCSRYNAMVTCGWVVLRFSFEEVFRRPDSVAETLRAAVALRAGGDSG